MTQQRPRAGTPTTPPKGRPTASKDQATRAQRHQSARQANLQWAAVILVGLVIFGLAIAFGGGGSGRVHDAPFTGQG